jgi:molybdate transport system substrate-binding protein
MSALSFARTSLLFCCIAACSSKKTAEPPLKIAAAADLARAFEEVGSEFGKTGHDKPIFTFGSTGLLAKQLMQGAPFDVFAAANISFADDVIKAGACDASTRSLYARGRIVVWVPKGKTAPSELKELAGDKYVKIAIANPDHAPYGQAAVEALKSAGIYDQVKPKLVYGENVQQTLQFAQSGNVEAAVVALSLAVVADGSYLPIDPTQHQPLDQAMLVCSKRRDAADFAAFVNSPSGRVIMRRYGFLLPGEVVAHTP